MPALPSVARVARLDVAQALGDDSNIINRFFIGWGGGGLSTSDAAAWALTAYTGWANHILAQQSSSLELETVTVTDLTSPTSPVAVQAGGSVGTLSGDVMPAGDCVSLRFKVARRYRGGHPGVFISGIPKSEQVTPQTWSGTYIAALLAGWEDMIAAVISGAPSSISGVFHANVSYFAGSTPVTYPSGRVKNVPIVRPTPVVDPIISAKADSRIKNQRRRNLA